MQSVYTCHSADCKHYGDKLWRRCNCPKWIVGSSHDGEFYPLSAKTLLWDEAEQYRHRLEDPASILSRPVSQAAPMPITQPTFLPHHSSPRPESWSSRSQEPDAHYAPPVAGENPSPPIPPCQTDKILIPCPLRAISVHPANVVFINNILRNRTDGSLKLDIQTLLQNLKNSSSKRDSGRDFLEIPHRNYFFSSHRTLACGSIVRLSISVTLLSVFPVQTSLT